MKLKNVAIIASSALIAMVGMTGCNQSQQNVPSVEDLVPGAPGQNQPIAGDLRTDSLALVELYNATEGAKWHRANGWLEAPLKEWKGVKVETVDGEERVTQLRVGGNNLKGMVPACLGKLHALRGLDLSYNYGLRGELPKELYGLTRLEVLKVGMTNISGGIAPEIGRLIMLDTLDMRNGGDIVVSDEETKNGRGRFSGSIPAEIGNLSLARYIDLSRNDFSGSIPSEIGKLASITYLSLRYNKLTGDIPESIGKLRNIRGLSLDHNNLTGSIPASMGDLSNLERFSLEYNNLTGAIPHTLAKLDRVWMFLINNNQISGNIPAELGQMKSLQVVFMSDNKLEGQMPEWVVGQKGSQLAFVDLSNNRLTGTVPTPVKHIRFTPNKYSEPNYTTIWLKGNMLTGALPTEFLNHVSDKTCFVPQQEGYGFSNLTKEEADRTKPKEKEDPWKDYKFDVL